MFIHLPATTTTSELTQDVYVVSLSYLLGFKAVFHAFYSLHAFDLPSCRNCELLSALSSSHPQHALLRGRATSITTTNLTTTSLGLLQLLQDLGISASAHPHHNLPYGHITNPSGSLGKDRGDGSSLDREGRRNVFSLNLVEKLQSLGLHRVAARGMTGHSEAERDQQPDAL